LREEGREDLAVRAHGYLLLTAEQEREVVRRSSPTNPNDSDDDDIFGRSLEPLACDRPVHAIVKAFATSESPFEPGQVEQLCDDLEAFHGLGILIRDITISNYLGGKLIDFSRAWTAPHPSLERIYENHLEKQRWRDPYDLQNCIVDWGLQDGWEEVNLPKKLLACILKESEHDGCGTDPRRYDWRKWEKDLAAVDAFMENELYGPPYPPYEEWVWEEETA
jgi:hypothetical protein